MEFRILGPLEVLDGDHSIEIAGSKRRAVLALLVLRANEVVRTERLIDELWGESPPVNATAALHNHLSRLRKALGPDLIVRREWGYALRTPDDGIDLQIFERLLVEADPLPANERAAALARALALWRDAPLSDLAHEPALQRDIARLEELRVGTIERRIDADLEAGRSSELIGEVESLIAEHPLREHLRSQLILALYRAGRQAEALEVYRETRRVLAEELGLDPSPELRELEKAILRQDPSLVSSAGISPTARLDSASRPSPPASRHRRWLVGGIAAILLASGGAATLLLAERGGSSQAVGTKHFVGLTSNSLPLPRGFSTISDSFGGSTIDDRVWYEIYSGNNWRMNEHDGHLEFTFPPTSTPGGTYDNFGGHVGTLCKFPGDFDARVDFDLVEWPASNGLYLGLTSFLGPENTGFQAGRSSDVGGGQQYTSFTGFWSNYIAHGDSGALRIARRRGVVTTYYLNQGQWLPMRSGANTESAVIAVGVSGNGANHLGGETAVVDFTNFSVSGANPLCPPNATPPTR